MSEIIHDCTVSALIEQHIFKAYDYGCQWHHEPKAIYDTIKKLVPHDECPICLEKLEDKGKYGHCGTYSEPLIKCGHWMHVSCQIDQNPNRHKCPICRVRLFNKHKLSIILEIRKILCGYPLYVQFKASNGLINAMKGFDMKISDNDIINDKLLEDLFIEDKKIEW